MLSTQGTCTLRWLVVRHVIRHDVRHRAEPRVLVPHVSNGYLPEGVSQMLWRRMDFSLDRKTDSGFGCLLATDLQALKPGIPEYSFRISSDQKSTFGSRM
jgi:hypothetical protein